MLRYLCELELALGRAHEEELGAGGEQLQPHTGRRLLCKRLHQRLQQVRVQSAQLAHHPNVRLRVVHINCYCIILSIASQLHSVRKVKAEYTYPKEVPKPRVDVSVRGFYILHSTTYTNHCKGARARHLEVSKMWKKFWRIF
jgi:hypothetical protein